MNAQHISRLCYILQFALLAHPWIALPQMLRRTAWYHLFQMLSPTNQWLLVLWSEDQSVGRWERDSFIGCMAILFSLLTSWYCLHFQKEWQRLTLWCFQGNKPLRDSKWSCIAVIWHYCYGNSMVHTWCSTHVLHRSMHWWWVAA